MKHAKAMIVIERMFGQLKGLWAILRSNSYYPVETHDMVMMACTYLHNFIKVNMEYDPVLGDEEYIIQLEQIMVANDGECEEYIEVVESSQAWSAIREQLAQQMWPES
ncbi:hypothetical protein SASPL_108736 [Salvia splendens]|uniref:DDE Tnp4 domain-containing protein n=1 Tax=Salvia splendens TaxID=180675 RepID=A0A8X9A8H3_SALSN|nr:uncharacterized protein LOC121796819 [Salvia splendens]KAG6430664.1 hypothetical protein SASPL_108736 [Salvia splendens]